MPLSKLPLPEEAPTVQFHIANLMPSGYLSLLFAPAGVGNTRLMAHLAVQTVRPCGAFAGQRVRSGRVLILDADDPSGTGYAQWLVRFLKAFPDVQRACIDHRAVSGGLTRQDVLDLMAEFEPSPPVLIIVDTFATCFVGLDVIKPHLVSEPMGALALLAHRTGAAVVLLDHVGKLAPGQSVAEKGAMGTAAKLALPRAAFALDRLPPGECEGRDVVRLTCVKQSYAQQPDPIGLEFIWDEFEGVSVEPYALPLTGRGAAQARAEQTLHLLIKAAGAAGIARSQLLEQTVNTANVSRRTAAEVLGRIQGGFITEVLPERGSPQIIRMKAEADLLMGPHLTPNTLELVLHSQ